MAFYALKFGEKCDSHPQLKSRGIDNRSFVPVRDPNKKRTVVTHLDPLPLLQQQMQPSVGPSPAVPSVVSYSPEELMKMTTVTPMIGSQSQQQVPIPLPPPSSAAPPVVPQRTLVGAQREVALTFQLPSMTKERQVFDRLDFNGNGMLSLAELDKAVVELWPMFNHKPAIMRAYKAADANGTGFLSRKEFSLFLRFLVRYTEIWCIFTQMDTSGDRRLSCEEFVAGGRLLGLEETPQKLRAIFNKLDKNGGGFVLFDEMCSYLADEEIREARERLVIVKKVQSQVKRSEYLDLPMVKDIRKLFDQLDVNRNGVLSLAELDKAVVELWPTFNNKPALMRAYKASDLNGNGLIGKKEFSAFLQFLVVYHNLWQHFAAMDKNGDRRLTLSEFLSGAGKMTLFAGKSREELEKLFSQLDTNGGGVVLFDEFCNYAAIDAVKEYMQSKGTAATSEMAKEAQLPPAQLPCSLMCHVCGKYPADLGSHLPSCSKDYDDKVKLFPSYLKRHVPTMPVPKPTRPQDVGHYNETARIIHDRVSVFTCPECSKPWPIHLFLGHFKTHKITYDRKMELEKNAVLRNPQVEHLQLPSKEKVVDVNDVILNIKLQCLAPFDLSKLSILKKQLYVAKVRSPQVTVAELQQILSLSGVSGVTLPQVTALLKGERGDISAVMAMLDNVGCSEERRRMIRARFSALDPENIGSVEFRQLMTHLKTPQLQEMFSRPLERHISLREFESVLNDLSALYTSDDQFALLLPTPPSNASVKGGCATVDGWAPRDDLCRMRITAMSGEQRVLEIAALPGTTLKKDKASLLRRLSLLGVTDVQKLEVIA